MAKIKKGGLGMTEWKKYKHKESGEIVEACLTADKLPIYFIKMDTTKNMKPLLFYKEEFLEQYQPIN